MNKIKIVELKARFWTLEILGTYSFLKFLIFENKINIFFLILFKNNNKKKINKTFIIFSEKII